MRIIITRHGETIENINGIFMGHLHGTLSEKGITQAKKLAIRLKDETFDYILSSDLRRAADTANEIHKFHKTTPIVFTDKLRERNLGELQGKRKEDLGFDKNKLIAGTVESKTGETQKDAYHRAKEFVKFLKDNYSDKNVLIVAHNGINMALIANLLMKRFEDYDKIEPQNNCAVTIISSDNKNPFLIELWNNTEHLK